MLSLLVLPAACAVTAYLALTYENTGLMLLAYMEAALFVLSVIELIMRKFTVRGRLEIPVGISEKNHENLIKITLNNKGIFPVARIKAGIVIRDVMRGKKEWCWFTLPVAVRGESTFIREMRFSKIGSYEIILKKLRVYDMTGLLHTDIRMKSKGLVRVMPKLNEVSVRVSEKTRNFYGESDVYDKDSPGQDNSELFQVREYRAGDRLQNVHWKLSVKQDDIMVKEHSLPKACPVVLFLEYNPRKKDRRGHTIIPFMEVVVSLSFSMMNAGCPHYVIWYDGEEKDVKRQRVDDEESLFIFIDTLMKVKWIKYEENLFWRYQEKYHREPYVHAFYLDTDLRLKKNTEMINQLSKKKLEKSLEQVELLL